MNTNIILTEQLLNAFKEIERLKNELEQAKNGREHFANEFLKLQNQLNATYCENYKELKIEIA